MKFIFIPIEIETLKVLHDKSSSVQKTKPQFLCICHGLPTN